MAVRGGNNYIFKKMISVECRGPMGPIIVNSLDVGLTFYWGFQICFTTFCFNLAAEGR